MADFDCGAPVAPVVSILGAGNTPVPLFVTGSDTASRGLANQVINMTTESGDYVPDFEFIILIETAAPIVVQLANGDAFTISTAYTTAYLGDWIPMKLKRVYKVGTTGTFSVGR
jgi:hypothetical protein